MSGISASAPVACRDSVARFVFPMTTWDRLARTMPVCFWVARCVARIRQTALLRCLDARNSRIGPEPGTLATTSSTSSTIRTIAGSSGVGWNTEWPWPTAR